MATSFLQRALAPESEISFLVDNVGMYSDSLIYKMKNPRL